MVLSGNKILREELYGFHHIMIELPIPILPYRFQSFSPQVCDNLRSLTVIGNIKLRKTAWITGITARIGMTFATHCSNSQLCHMIADILIFTCTVAYIHIMIEDTKRKSSLRQLPV